MIKAEIVLDSVNAATGDRITTFKIRIPKFLLAQIARHRTFSINAASSRAIPVKKIRRQVLSDPFVPIQWGQNCKGMQSHGVLPTWKARIAKILWLLARYPAVLFHWLLSDVLSVHKEISNRLLESFMWADVIISSTEWKNFFALRCHEDAQPEFREVAIQMRQLLENNVPQRLNPNEWHLPFINWEEKEEKLNIKKCISAARCARTSYLLPEGGFSTPSRDIELCDRLMAPPLHASPYEHVCAALPTSERVANFVGFRQWRKDLPSEANDDYASVPILTQPEGWALRNGG